MKFKYVGPHDEVEVPALAAVVRRGGTVEAVGEAAESLEQQPGAWERVATKKETDR